SGVFRLARVRDDLWLAMTLQHADVWRRNHACSAEHGAGKSPFWTAADFRADMRQNDTMRQSPVTTVPHQPGGTRMVAFHKRLFGVAVAISLGMTAPALSQQLDLKVMAPAAPGGGWDQTARA